MKKAVIFLILSIGFSQSESDYFPTEIRTRLLDNDIVQVVVQVGNHSEYTVIFIEGFVTVYDGHLEIVEEKRLALVQEYEPGLEPGNIATRSINFDYDKTVSRQYTFHIGKLKFRGDHRTYYYNPISGLVRID